MKKTWLFIVLGVVLASILLVLVFSNWQKMSQLNRSLEAANLIIQDQKNSSNQNLNLNLKNLASRVYEGEAVPRPRAGDRLFALALWALTLLFGLIITGSIRAGLKSLKRS